MAPRPSRQDHHRPRSAAAGARPSGSPRPSPWQLAGLWTLLAVATVYAVSHMNTSVDTWISLAGGRHILAHGVDTADPFSYNSRDPTAAPEGVTAFTAALPQAVHPRGWINQNWLSHVLLYALERAAGYDALVAWKLVNYGVVALLLVVAARIRRASLPASLLAAAVALVAARSFLEMRAQDLANLCLAALFVALALAVHRSYRLLWLAVPLLALWADLHGSFVYGLGVLWLYTASHLVLARRRPATWARTPHAWRHAAGTAFAAVAATVLLSPYRLANLTHPLEATVGADAAVWQVVSEWRPLWEESVGSTTVFLLFAGALLLVLAIRLLGSRRRPPAPGAELAAADALAPADVAVVLLTLAAAVHSRRFIPIACFTGAPILAAWFTGLRAAARPRPRRAKARPPVHRRQRRAELAATWLAVAVAATLVGARVERTFLAPWPMDAEHTSLFARLTHASRRPWGACRFLGLNQVHGRMWNPWEESGFLAWCQTPEAGGGRLPVQLFIDGRAQAAYPVAAARAYATLSRGGPIGTAAIERGTPMTAAETAAAAAWVADRLAASEIWIAELPLTDDMENISRLLLTLPRWRAVFVGGGHMLLVDSATDAGRALDGLVEAGLARFPDEPSRLTTLAFRALANGGAERAREALAMAGDALRLRPSAEAVNLVAQAAAAAPELEAEAEATCRGLVDDFLANRDALRSRAGYYKRLAAAAAGLRFLRDRAAASGRTDESTRAGATLAGLEWELDAVARAALW